MLETLFFCYGLSLIIGLLFELYPLALDLFGKPNLVKYRGSWAIVTGSTDGIGLGYCNGLAQFGINILQISRNPEKLSQVASELRAKYGIQVKNISRDFGACPKNPNEFFRKIFEEIGDLNVKILINNVGSHSMCALHEESVENVLLQNACNTWPIVYMTKFFINRTKYCEETDLVINISSISGNCGLYRRIIYSATKSFDKVFSNILSEEKSNITCFQPGYIITQMTKDLTSMFLVIKVEEYVKSSLKQFGKVKNSYGNRVHCFTALLMYLISGQQNLITNLSS